MKKHSARNFVLVNLKEMIYVSDIVDLIKKDLWLRSVTFYRYSSAVFSRKFALLELSESVHAISILIGGQPGWKRK